MEKIKRKPYGYWNADRVNENIKDRLERGLSLTPKDVIVEDGGLYNAGLRHYGSWSIALEANGIDYKEWYKHNLQGSWTEEAVRNYLNKRKREGLSLIQADVIKDDSTFVQISRRDYGTWGEILALIGEKEEDNRRRGSMGYWTKETVKAELEKRLGEGGSLQSEMLKTEDDLLYTRARKVYGSLGAALLAIGEDLKDYPGVLDRGKRKWTKELVVSELRTRREEGKTQQPIEARKEDSGLYLNALKYFGRWSKALDELDK